MPIQFTAHNIRLDDGTLTRPEMSLLMEAEPWFVAARRLLGTLFPGDRRAIRLADLGCLEGGYAVEFARMGFSVLGVDVRESNIEACRYVQSKTNLPNLRFVCDDVWNLARYGEFDVVFCCGLLYHLDRPRQFLEMISTLTTKALIVQTHFSTQEEWGARKAAVLGTTIPATPHETTADERTDLRLVTDSASRRTPRPLVHGVRNRCRFHEAREREMVVLGEPAVVLDTTRVPSLGDRGRGVRPGP
jgi:SAM-dependent methyltransferase